jgi:hypothetical protein
MRSYLKKKVAAPVWKTKIIGLGGSAALTTRHPSTRKESVVNSPAAVVVGRYSSLAD